MSIFFNCTRQEDARSHHASASAMPCFVFLLPLLIMFIAEIMCSVVVVVHSVDPTAVMMYKLVRCSVNVISQVSLLSQFAHTETEGYYTALHYYTLTSSVVWSVDVSKCPIAVRKGFVGVVAVMK